MSTIKYNENAINLMKHAHSIGISKGMETYMSWLSEKRQHVTYIPKNEDNTYIIKSANSLRDTYPKPKGAIYIRRRDYDTITLHLLEYAAKRLHDFTEDNIPKVEYKCKNELSDNCSIGERVDILCEEITAIAKSDFLAKVSFLEKEDDDRSREALIRVAEKEGLVPQEEFYVNKFIESLDKNPGVSEIYASLDSDQKKDYAETCYIKLYFMANGYTHMTISEAFESMLNDSEVFIEMDNNYKDAFPDARRNLDMEEEDERNF